MASFPVPPLLAEYVAEHGSPDHRAWLGRLPEIVGVLSERWSLEVGAPFQPGGRVSWVAPARDGAGRDLVLKAGWTHDECRDEAAGLRVWAGRGAVQVLDVHVDGPTTALLLERCVPGTTCKSALAESEQDEVVAGLLRQLWCEPPAGHQFRALVQMCDWWADEFDKDLVPPAGSPPHISTAQLPAGRTGEPPEYVQYEGRLAGAPSGNLDPPIYAPDLRRGTPAAEPGALDPGLARAGMELFRGLPREDVPQRLLATDLHAENVLAAQRAPWLVIDPKPYVGDPAYDVLQHMLNCSDRLLTDPHGLARRMAGLTGLDPERVQLWLFARTVQESIDEPWLRPLVPRLAPR